MKEEPKEEENKNREASARDHDENLSKEKNNGSSRKSELVRKEEEKKVEGEHTRSPLKSHPNKKIMKIRVNEKLGVKEKERKGDHREYIARLKVGVKERKNITGPISAPRKCEGCEGRSEREQGREGVEGEGGGWRVRGMSYCYVWNCPLPHSLQQE